MMPFTNFESRMVPLPINNVDTDQIIPARFLKTTSKEGLDKQLFNDWRYDAQAIRTGFHPQSAASRRACRSCWPAIISAAAARASMRRGRSRSSASAP